jgi:hypothetical protein
MENYKKALQMCKEDPRLKCKRDWVQPTIFLIHCDNKASSTMPSTKAIKALLPASLTNITTTNPLPIAAMAGQQEGTQQICPPSRRTTTPAQEKGKNQP